MTPEMISLYGIGMLTDSQIRNFVPIRKESQSKEGSMMATGAPNAQSFEEGAKEPEP